MEIHLNLSIQKGKFIKIYISNELETLIRSPVFTNIIWIMLMRYQAFNIVHLSRYDKYKTGHFEVGAGGGAKYLLVIIQSKLTSVKVWSLVTTMTCTVYGVVFILKLLDTVHKSRKCIQNVVLKIGNALIYLFPLSEFDWIKCTQFQGKIGNSFKFQFLFSEFHW